MHHRHIFSLFFLLNLFYFPNPTTTTTTFPSDVATLFALKSSILPSSIPPWSCLATWNFSSDPCHPSLPSHFTCGLSCTHSLTPTRISAISLDPVHYTASLAHLDLSNLTSLLIVNLANNAFYGPIPTSISSLTHLQTLDLSSNSFSGSIPPSLSRLSSLQSILLSRNSLSGPIPESLGSLSSLRTLDFSSNHLYGGLPRRLPPNLVDLALRDNLLSGPIQKSSLMPLVNLQVLELGLNRFDGTLEGWLLVLPSLQQLNLANNSITSLRVWSPTETSNLVALDVGYNNISGSLPVDLANYPTLAALTLRYNRLTGSIPWQYFGAKKGLAFRRMFLDGNFLNGKVPEGFFGGGGSEVVGSFGDNCLQNCPATLELCSPAQKPDSVCKQIYGAVMID